MAEEIKYGLKVNGYTFPIAYNGYTFSVNRIWSSDTGRSQTGEMLGTLVATKRKCECTMKPLKVEDARILRDLVNDTSRPFVTVTYNDLGEEKTMVGYFGDISFPYLGTNIPKHGTLISGIKVDVIEK